MRILKQLALIISICLAGELLSVCIGGFLPGNVIGMVLMLLLLISGKLRPDRVGEVSDFFEHNMPIFFLPTCMGILELPGEVKAVLLPILAVVVISTVLTAVAAAATVRLVSSWERKRKEGKRHAA